MLPRPQRDVTPLTGSPAVAPGYFACADSSWDRGRKRSWWRQSTTWRFQLPRPERWEPREREKWCVGHQGRICRIKTRLESKELIFNSRIWDSAVTRTTSEVSDLHRNKKSFFMEVIKKLACILTSWNEGTVEDSVGYQPGIQQLVVVAVSLQTCP